MEQSKFKTNRSFKQVITYSSFQKNNNVPQPPVELEYFFSLFLFFVSLFVELVEI